MDRGTDAGHTIPELAEGFSVLNWILVPKDKGEITIHSLWSLKCCWLEKGEVWGGYSLLPRWTLSEGEQCLCRSHHRRGAAVHNGKP